MAHCSGALGLDVLAPHERVASLHPLVTLPDPVIGAVRLRSGGYFVVAGDQLATDLALALGGRPLVIPADTRPVTTRPPASRRTTSSRCSARCSAWPPGRASARGVPAPCPGALDDVGLLGPAAALTGPAARGDLVTIERHRQVLDPAELDGYDAGVALARRLAASAGAPNCRSRTHRARRRCRCRSGPCQ